MLDSFFPQRQGQNKVPDFSSWLAELDEQKQKWQMTFPKFDAPQLTKHLNCEDNSNAL
jgi:hypothetical protein